MKTLTTILITLALTTAAQGADWPNWRGPNYNGSAEASGLPDDFAKDKHVKWAVDLPGPAAATPIVLGDKLFLSSTDLKSQKLLAMCVDRKTGKVLWQQEAGSGYQPGGAGTPIQLQDNSNYASPSPVTDGQRVVFFYGNGDLIAYGLDGKRLWGRNLQRDHGDFSYQWTYSASPTLYAGKLYVQILQRDEPVHDVGKEGNESFLLALDPATGETIWKHIRPSDANKESLESFATPIPYEHDGRKELLIAGGDYLTGHDPETGRELWRWGTWNPEHREEWWRLVPSPVVGEGVALVCAPKRAPVYAVQVPVSPNDQPKLLWTSESNKAIASDVPTPAFAHGSFYILNDQRPVGLSRVDPKTGKAIWTTEMPGKFLYRSSPTVADGKVYCMNYHGDVTVVDAQSGKLLHTAAMGEEDDDYTPSTIVAADSDLFIRTQTKLYRISAKSD